MTVYRFIVAYDCGHRTYTTQTYSAGLAWCDFCHDYVGTVIQRIKPPAAAPSVSLPETEKR